MNNPAKNILLCVAVLMIGASIWYLESKKPVATAEPSDIVVQVSTSTPSQAIDKSAKYPRAKELVDPKGFVNTSAFKLSDIVGKKVVLIDFWTYSCINCQRTIPYLNAWYKKYKDLGLEIVGVHTPEFDFEKDYANVSRAVSEAGIKYPVVLDSNQGTWNAYQNLYWPREYLIDIDGFIIHDHIGEGSYDETERAIQEALKERAKNLGLNINIPSSIVSPADVVSMDTSKVGSPETYFGSLRNEFLGNGDLGISGPQTLTLPKSIQTNTLYLEGSWNFRPEFAESTGASSKIVYKYSAKNVYFVASGQSGVPIKVMLDGKIVGTITVKDNKLYTLIEGKDYGPHTLEIDVEAPGLDAFTFTFG